MKLVESDGQNGSERRIHRRADLEPQDLRIDRWDGARRRGETFGQIMDISAGGVRIRTQQKNVRVDNQIRVRIELPDYAGISPFVQTQGEQVMPAREWVGWMSVSRVSQVDGKAVDIAGRLVGMEEVERGMLGLYLSTQPMAA